MPEVSEIVINAVFTGAGTAVGAFLGTRLVVHKLEGLLERLKNGVKP
ncbi:MAG TPA: hypothetical protein VJH23_01165 [archaeon]|nr:hypothetical protein [archaeon]